MMAAAAHLPDRLVPPPDGMPPLRGRVVRDAPLGASTWFRVGGSADVLVRPADAAWRAGLVPGARIGAAYEDWMEREGFAGCGG